MGDGGELERAPAGWRVKRYDHVAKSELRQNSAKVAKFSNCRKSIRKQIRPSCRKNLSTSFCVCLVSWKQRNLEILVNIPKWCCRPVVSLLYATKSAFTAPNLGWACALASPVTFLTGDHVMQIGFGQISPSASSTRDLGTRLYKAFLLSTFLKIKLQHLRRKKYPDKWYDICDKNLPIACKQF